VSVNVIDAVISKYDYGAAAAKYIDAFFQNVNWDAVNGRLDAAEKASALLRR